MTTYTVGYFVGSLATESVNRKHARALVRLAPEQLAMREIPFKVRAPRLPRCLPGAACRVRLAAAGQMARPMQRGRPASA